MRYFLLSMLLACNLFWVSAQNADWLRYPAISPDGKVIAFSYKGDIFLVSSSGGSAKQLTSNPAYDYRPVWSPDGTHLAFASTRYGNKDVFIVPIEGGHPKRLTFHSSNEIPEVFSPDGKSIYFSARLTDHVDNVQFPSGMLTEFYQVATDGGRAKLVLTTPVFDANFSKDGNKLIYHDRKGYENTWRKHHTSSIARDIWVYDFTSKKHTKESTFSGEDRNPVFAKGDASFFFLSEKSGNFNVWKKSLGKDDAEQITSFPKHPVRFLSISQEGTLCFSHHGTLYIKQEGAEPQKIAVQVLMDSKEKEVIRQVRTKGVTDYDVSPDAKEVAFILQGDVFVTSVEYSTTRRITNTPEAERNVSFSPDGRSLLYEAERPKSWNLYISKLMNKEEVLFTYATHIEEETVLVDPKPLLLSSYSPDGTEVAFFYDRKELRVVNLKSKQVRTIVKAGNFYSYSDNDQWYQWSPCGKWFVISYLAKGRWDSEVGLVKSDGSEEPHNLSQSGYRDSYPRFSPDGKMLYWLSNKFGYRSHGGHGAQRNYYLMFLTEEGYQEYRMSKEDLALKKEEFLRKEQEKKKKIDEDKKAAEKEEEKKKKEEKKEEAKQKKEGIKIDFEGIEKRIVRLTPVAGSYEDAYIDKKGENFYYVYEKTIWKQELTGKKKKTQFAKIYGGNFIMDKKGKNVFILSMGKIYHLTKKKFLNFSAEFEHKPAQERDYIFAHAWQLVRDKFYDPSIHGLDWEALFKDYEGFLPHINNGYDFSEMLSELLGELNASHTGCRYLPTFSGDATAALGAFYDPNHTGNGLKIKEIILNGAIAHADKEIKEGMVILKIDGQTIEAGKDYFHLLNHKGGKRLRLTIQNEGKTFDAHVKAISQKQLNSLLYDRWVEQRTKETLRLSNGEIGYVHVKGMNPISFTKIYTDLLGKFVAKKGVVVDTRFNGGGWLHDDLATLLSGKRYLDFVPQGQKIGSEPMEKWFKPSIVLMSEGNYSDAHGFPYTYKALGIGKLVGMPVPGTMTAVWWERQINPQYIVGVPQTGVKDLEGNYLENLQLEPDVRAPQNPNNVISGEDEQLKAAVLELQKEL